jgi:hypothetical protein
VKRVLSRAVAAAPPGVALAISSRAFSICRTRAYSSARPRSVTSTPSAAPPFAGHVRAPSENWPSDTCCTLLSAPNRTWPLPAIRCRGLRSPPW